MLGKSLMYEIRKFSYISLLRMHGTNSNRGTHWVFTENRPCCWRWGTQLPSGVRHMLYQTEEAPTTKKKHLQGMLSLIKRQRLKWLKKNISSTAHWELRKGTFEQALKYNCKDKTRIGDIVELVNLAWIPIQ